MDYVMAYYYQILVKNRGDCYIYATMITHSDLQRSDLEVYFISGVFISIFTLHTYCTQNNNKVKDKLNLEV